MPPVVKRLKGRKGLTNDVDESVNADSDCEGEDDSTGTDGGALKDEGNEETRAILIAGSFSAYVRLLTRPHTCRNDALQVEVSLFLSLHGHYLVRSSQISRRRLSLGSHSGEHHSRCAPSLFTEEHLRFGKLGETTPDRRSRRLD